MSKGNLVLVMSTLLENSGNIRLSSCIVANLSRLGFCSIRFDWYGCIVGLDIQPSSEGVAPVMQEKVVGSHGTVHGLLAELSAGFRAQLQDRCPTTLGISQDHAKVPAARKPGGVRARRSLDSYYWNSGSLCWRPEEQSNSKLKSQSLGFCSGLIAQVFCVGS